MDSGAGHPGPGGYVMSGGQQELHLTDRDLSLLITHNA